MRTHSDGFVQLAAVRDQEGCTILVCRWYPVHEGMSCKHQATGSQLGSFDLFGEKEVENV